MKEVRSAIIAGSLLIALALIAYFASGMASFTALIPAVAGLPILVGGLIAKNPDKLKLGMHIVAVFALLGTLAPLGRLIPLLIGGGFTITLTTISLILMLAISAWILIVCIKSFKAARQARTGA